MTAPSPNKLPLGDIVDDTPARLPRPVTLHGRFGRVEKLSAAKYGAALWQAFKGHDDIWAYMRLGPFANEKAFLDFLSYKEAQSDPYVYVIINSQDQPLGLSALMAIRPDMRVIEVGHIAYAPALQRTPLGTEAQYLLMKYAFEELGYRRYEWKCNALNEKSRRAAERYGFIFEGIFRQLEILKGRNRDTAWYSMLDKEWPAVKRNFERWLAAENFDAEGKQKTALASER